MSNIIDAVELTSKLIRCESITPNSGGAIDLIITYLEPLGFKCEKIVNFLCSKVTKRNLKLRKFQSYGPDGHGQYVTRLNEHVQNKVVCLASGLFQECS